MLEKGVKVTVVAATVTTMNGLQRDGVDWTTVDDADLVRRCAGKPERLHRLRRGLCYAFGDADARRRWPDVFRRVNKRPAVVDNGPELGWG